MATRPGAGTSRTRNRNNSNKNTTKNKHTNDNSLMIVIIMARGAPARAHLAGGARREDEGEGADSMPRSARRDGCTGNILVLLLSL